MLTVHELARKGHFNIRDSQLSALCGYKHPVLVNWGGEEETQSWKWPRVQEGFFFFSRRFSWLQTNRSREASPELKSHFYPRLASCAAKRHFNCFPFSWSHKASSLPEYTNYHPFFFLHTTENNCKLRLSKRSAVCSAQFEVILVSQQSEGENQRWLLSGWTVCPIRRFQWLQLQRHCANVVVTLCVCVCE